MENEGENVKPFYDFRGAWCIPSWTVLTLKIMVLFSSFLNKEMLKFGSPYLHVVGKIVPAVEPFGDFLSFIGASHTYL